MRKPSRRVIAQSLTAIGGAAALALSAGVARAADAIDNGGYHAQTTNHWCAAASVEMMMDVPAVINNNAVVAQMLGVGDGPTVAAGDPTSTIQIQNGAGTVTSRAQAFIYGLNHGRYTVNGIGPYFNPYCPVGAGTDNTGIVFDTQLLDNPNANGATNLAWAFGSHAYAGYNTAPTFVGQTLASRTMAAAIAQYGVPAQATVLGGAHSITVYGVSTNVAVNQILPNQNYTINGFYIHDPWTGYVASQLAAGNNTPLQQGGWGKGYNTFMRYGYDVVPAGFGVPVTLPNGNVANIRPGPWFSYFTVSGGQPGGSATFGTPGFKFTVEPQGPEALDTGDPANDGSLPAPPTASGNGTDISLSTALSDAGTDLTSDNLSSDVGLTGGSFDTNSADDMMIHMPGDTGTEGDWLIPYDGPNGNAGDPVTGAVLIDAQTGVLDEATWLDPTADGTGDMSLSQLDQMYADEAAGITPNDNSVPEPASFAVLAIIGGGLAMRRRRAK